MSSFAQYRENVQIFKIMRYILEKSKIYKAVSMVNLNEDQVAIRIYNSDSAEICFKDRFGDDTKIWSWDLSNFGFCNFLWGQISKFGLNWPSFYHFL